MFGKIKNLYKSYKSGKEIEMKYDEASNLLITGIFATLIKDYLHGMDQNKAIVVAGQVVNYFKGYDIDRIIQESQEPLKFQIMTIKDVVQDTVFKLMDNDEELRALVCQYLIFQIITGRQHKDKGFREDFTDIEIKQVDFILNKYAEHNTQSRIDDIDRFLLLVKDFCHDRVRQYEEAKK